MAAGDWAVLAWAVLGVAVGLFAANWIYSDSKGDAPEHRGFTALCGFVFAIAFLPLIVAGAAIFGAAWLGAWLLPAYRVERRERCAKARRTEAESRS